MPIKQPDGYKRFHQQGYIIIKKVGHPTQDKDGYVPEHRLVMEEKIGRFINSKIEDVHHINKDRTDNRIENLMLLPRKDHIRIHFGWEKIGEKWFKICKGCNRFLEVSAVNFQKRTNPSGDSCEFLHKCKSCQCEYDKLRRKTNGRSASLRSLPVLEL